MSAITATVSILGSVLLACIGYYFTKKREHENEIMKLKLEYYKNFSNNLSNILSKNSTLEEKQEYAKSVNNLYLIATYDIIVALNNYIAETDSTEKEKKLSNLFFEIRKDIKINPKEAKDNFFVKMVCP